MSLTNRLSLYFLAALAVVLAGFSAAVYLLAARHLRAQMDHRLDAAMQTLVASTEVFPDHVEWEPLLRRITAGEETGPEHVRWTIHGLDGTLIDCSVNLEGPDGPPPAPDGKGSRVLVRRLAGGRFEPDAAVGRGKPFGGTVADGFPGGQAPGVVALPKDRTHNADGLVLTVAVSEGPVRATLHQLGLSLGAVSAVIWLTAAVWGRWLCRRALAPIVRMAASARSLHARPGEGAFLDVAPTADELEDLGRAFNGLLAGLRESLDRQRRFTGDASHQLRTPLTALLTSVEVAGRKERTPAEYQRVLDVVRRRGVQLRQIIESLLFLARAESDVPPELEEVNLVEWCRARLEGWAEHPRAADLVFQHDAYPAPVCTHPALLGQVLDNLLDNACKYSAPGRPVSVTVGAAGGGLVLAVADEGCGIAADERERVFEPFYRSPQARWVGAPGVGLGLTVVGRLVGLLGGRVTVDSRPGEGSRFAVTLPAQGTAEDRGVGEACEGVRAVGA